MKSGKREARAGGKNKGHETKQAKVDSGRKTNFIALITSQEAIRPDQINLLFQGLFSLQPRPGRPVK